jgi:hypothetical protein
MQIIIKTISHSPQVSKRTGKNYESCKITVAGKEGKDVIISGFGNDITRTWASGDLVDVETSQNEKGYWNFDLNENSKPAKSQIELLREINAKLDNLFNAINAPLATKNPQMVSLPTSATNALPVPNFGQ